MGGEGEFLARRENYREERGVFDLREVWNRFEEFEGNNQRRPEKQEEQREGRKGVVVEGNKRERGTCQSSLKRTLAVERPSNGRSPFFPSLPSAR